MPIDTATGQWVDETNNKEPVNTFWDTDVIDNSASTNVEEPIKQTIKQPTQEPILPEKKEKEQLEVPSEPNTLPSYITGQPAQEPVKQEQPIKKEEPKKEETKKLNLDDVNISDRVKEYISRWVEKWYTKEETKEKLKTELSKLWYDVSWFESDYWSLFENYNEYNRTKEDFVNWLMSGQTYNKWYEKNSTDYQEAKKIYEKIKWLDLSDEGIKNSIVSWTLDNETISYLSNNEQYKKAIQEGIKIKNEKIFNEATASSVTKMNTSELLKFTQDLLDKMWVTEKYETAYDDDEDLNKYKTEIETATINLTSLYAQKENIRAKIEAENPGASPRMIDMLVARERAKIDEQISEEKNKVDSYNSLYKIREWEISRTIWFKQDRAESIKAEFDKVYNQNLSIEFADISSRKQWALEQEKQIEKMNSAEWTWQNTKDWLYFVKNNGEYVKAVWWTIEEQYEENWYEITKYKQEDGSYIITKKNISTWKVKTTHTSPLWQEILWSWNWTGEVFNWNGWWIEVDEKMILKYPWQAWTKNNNPAWLTYTKTALKRFQDAWIDVYWWTDRPAKEGGKYLAFWTLEDWFKAYTMLWNQPWYQNDTVENALSTWWTWKVEWIDDLLNKKVSSLTEVEMARLQYAQLSKESPWLVKELEKKWVLNKPKLVSDFYQSWTTGWWYKIVWLKDIYKLNGKFVYFPQKSETSKSITQKYDINNKDDVLDYYNIVAQQLPTKDRDSDADKERLKNMSISYIKRWYDYPTAVLKVLWIPLPKKQEDLNLLIDYQNTLNGLLWENYSSKVLKSMSTHINNWEYSKAKAILNSTIDPRLKKDNDLYTDANTLAIQKSYTDNIISLSDKMWEENYWLIDTPINKLQETLWYPKEKVKRLETTLQQYLAWFRKSIAWTAVTDKELQQIKDFADATNKYSVKEIQTVVEQIFRNNLWASNSVRKYNWIPTISENELGWNDNTKNEVDNLYDK